MTTLTAAENPPTFRFLDLPGELQDIIYDFALLHDTSRNERANVALLRTCKEVHKEASKIFRQQSTANIRINFNFRWFKYPDDDDGVYSCDVSGDAHGHISDPGQLMRAIWEPHLERVASINLTIGGNRSFMEGQAKGEFRRILCNLFVSLRWFLRERERPLRRSRVEFESEGANTNEYSEAEEGFDLLALGEVSNQTQLEVVGLRPAVKQFIEQMRGWGV